MILISGSTPKVDLSVELFSRIEERIACMAQGEPLNFDLHGQVFVVEEGDSLGAISLYLPVLGNLVMRWSAKRERYKYWDWGVCSFGPIKPHMQCAGNRFDYLRIVQSTHPLFDRKPSWMANPRVAQEGLDTVNQNYIGAEI